MLDFLTMLISITYNQHSLLLSQSNPIQTLHASHVEATLPPQLPPFSKPTGPGGRWANVLSRFRFPSIGLFDAISYGSSLRALRKELLN
jgi:hypothetical protein